MKTTKVIALFVIVTMCTAMSVMAQNKISVAWTKSIAGQKITGASGLYTISIQNSTSVPATYEVHLWDASGNHNKVAEGTTIWDPQVLLFNDKLLVNRQNESAKLMTSTGTVIVEKTIPAVLPSPCVEAETKYFHTGSKLVRAIYTTKPGTGNVYSTKVEVYTDSLILISSKDFVGMQFVGISGDYLAGNSDNKGKLVSIIGTSVKDFTSPITGITAKGSDIYILTDKLYKCDAQLTEVWNKPATGNSLEFITDKAVIFNGTSAILYDDLFTGSLFTLSISQSGLVGINATSDAIYLATGSSLSKIILGGGTSPDGIEDILNASSIILYPNPTVNQITIKGLENPTIEILNMTGQVIISLQNNTIDVSSLPAGAYFCRIDRQLTKQFIKR